MTSKNGYPYQPIVIPGGRKIYPREENVKFKTSGGQRFKKWCWVWNGKAWDSLEDIVEFAMSIGPDYKISNRSPSIRDEDGE